MDRDPSEKIPKCLPVLLPQRPNHSASNTKGQPHSTAFLAGPKQTNQETQNTEVTKTGVSFEASVLVLLWKSGSRLLLNLILLS